MHFEGRRAARADVRASVSLVGICSRAGAWRRPRRGSRKRPAPRPLRRGGGSLRPETPPFRWTVMSCSQGAFLPTVRPGRTRRTRTQARGREAEAPRALSVVPSGRELPACVLGCLRHRRLFCPTVGSRRVSPIRAPPSATARTELALGENAGAGRAVSSCKCGILSQTQPSCISIAQAKGNAMLSRLPGPHVCVSTPSAVRSVPSG